MLELLIAAFLIVLNGLFSLSELAVVSSRKTRLRLMADSGRRGAASALLLADDPGRFLSTVQIGITLIGILAGAFSGAALGQRLTDWLVVTAGMPAAGAETLGYAVVIGVITYLSVVIGELVPKTLALRNAEGIACLVAPPMTIVSKIVGPAVWILDASTKALFRLFGSAAGPADVVTDEEIRSVVAEAQSSGSIEADERAMISGVLRLGDRAVRAIMTPRTDVDWLDVGQADSEVRHRLMASQHSRLPVCQGESDNMIGVLHVRDVLPALLAGQDFSIASLVKAAPTVPDTLDALDAFAILRRSSVPMALVHDEYGHFEGIVTPADLLDAIAGSFTSDQGADEEAAVQRDDGSWLLAGWMPVDEMAETLAISLPEQRPYQTVAGFVIHAIERLPRTGEHVTTGLWRFEVVDMDGRRVDKVLASRTT